MNSKICKFGCITILIAIVLPVTARHNTDSISINNEWSQMGSIDLNVIKTDNNGVTTRVITTQSDGVNYTNFEMKIKGRDRYREPQNNIAKRRMWGSFNGHWNGVYLGLTNYLYDGKSYGTNGGDMRLDWSGSRTLIINPYHADIKLSRSGRFGMIVGVGLEYQNLSFSDDHTSIKRGNNGVINPLRINSDYDVRRNKLKHLYITVPVIFEVQFNKVFISAGAIGAVRVHSKTKVVYDFEGDKRKMKNTDNFSMIPFKLDATAKVGYGKFALFCNYTLTEMFERNKGLDLHPLTIGVGFVWGL